MGIDQELPDERGHGGWSPRGAVAFDDGATRINEELCKVPLDAGAESARLLGLEPFEQRVGTLSVHLDLVHELELYVVLGHKLFDLLVCSWFLRTKLITRESVHRMK